MTAEHSFFKRYIGINYSGAKSPSCNLRSLRIFLSDHNSGPDEMIRALNLKPWNRRDLAEVMIDFLLEDNPEDSPTLIGINHGFSFPMRYFEAHHLEPDWPNFLADFRKHWPADEDDIYIDDILLETLGNAAARSGNTDWRRLTEERVGAGSAFDFDAPGSVAKRTHAGLPWLLHIRDLTGGEVHFWPFDGWDIPAGRSAIVETWPALWNKRFPRGDRTAEEQNAYTISAWLRQTDLAGELPKFLKPSLLPGERTVAEIEGWMFGVM